VYEVEGEEDIIVHVREGKLNGRSHYLLRNKPDLVQDWYQILSPSTTPLAPVQDGIRYSVPVQLLWPQYKTGMRYSVPVQLL